MIEITQGNLLESKAEALVNTVNCVGAMGKGIALQFKQAYPEMNKAYVKACERGEIQPGRVQVWETGDFLGPDYVINLPTKREWFRKSSYQYIESGLIALVQAVQEYGIKSVAIPPLGCGLGGLKWEKVRPMIEASFAALPHVRVELYEPLGAPEAEDRVIRTKKPHLTRARALFLSSIDRYSVLAYKITLLEIQKLGYFLQAAGEPLRLKVEKGPYGPYADNLNKVLEVLEGHYIRGYDGDRSPNKEIELLDGTADEAAAFLERKPEALERLAKVGELIEGFETPYGMELLSSVHFVAHEETDSATSVDEAIQKVLSWNDRKRRLFSPDHIVVAWNHLVSAAWISKSN